MIEDPTHATRFLNLTFRCCNCGNRTGMVEAFILDNGEVCCSRCADANVLDEMQMLVLVES
jgi:predicted nucleic acid-binding Zn ribbon protein